MKSLDKKKPKSNNSGLINNQSTNTGLLVKKKIIKKLIKDVRKHQDTAETSEILAFWDQVSYWLNLKLNER